MESREQKLIEMKKKLLRVAGNKQNEEIILRLEEIAKLLTDKDLSEKVEKLVIDKVETSFPDKIKVSNLKDIKPPVVNTEKIKFPESFEVSNIKDIPKPVVNVKKNVLDIKNPIKTLYKSLQGLLEPIISKVLQYISEPDRTVIDKDKITDYYGSRTVEYKLIKRGGRIREVVRDER